MKKNSSVVTIILVILVVCLGGFIVVDKVFMKNTSTASSSDETKMTEGKSAETSKSSDTKAADESKSDTQSSTSNVDTTDAVPSESELREALGVYIKKQYPSMVEYRINKVSLDSNTDEIKEMIHLDKSSILVSYDFEMVRNGDGYTKEQGFVKINQLHIYDVCTLYGCDLCTSVVYIILRQKNNKTK